MAAASSVQIDRLTNCQKQSRKWTRREWNFVSRYLSPFATAAIILSLLPFLLSGRRKAAAEHCLKIIYINWWQTRPQTNFQPHYPVPSSNKTSPPKWLNICVLSLTRVMRLNGVFNENKVYLDNLLLLHDIIGCRSSELPHDADCNFQHC